jgi:hypothetical protein
MFKSKEARSSKKIMNQDQNPKSALEYRTMIDVTAELY